MPAVVWIPDGDRGWELPAALPTDHGWLGGGRRTMHELAVAVACAGVPVELRGEFDEAVLRELAGAAGACPDLPDRPRAPAEDDTVFVYEGVPDPLVYARLALSPAHPVLMLLAPPGLCGWPFSAEWSEPDPLTVPLEAVGRPEHFQAAGAVGFELWTNAPDLRAAAERAGVACRSVGRGLPHAFPQPARDKDIEVLALANNRWAPLADVVVEELGRRGVTVVRPPRVTNRELIELLGRARVLIHPMRIEGNSRLACEARAMGAVPVVLEGNPFASNLDDAHGAVAVPSPEEMAGATCGLLADEARLERLAATGMEWARAEFAWEPYVERVADGLASPAEDFGRPARAAMGAALRDSEPPDSADIRAELDRHRRWLADTNSSVSWRVTSPLRSAKRLVRRR
jgi:hypothetical protein